MSLIEEREMEGEPSCVSMKSHISMNQPPNLSDGDVTSDPVTASKMSFIEEREKECEPSCVSMKSHISMNQPPNLSDGDVTSDPVTASKMSLIEESEKECEPSCVSMKSHRSMDNPPKLNDGDVTSDPVTASKMSLIEESEKECEPSCVSMKSNRSMDIRPNLSDGDVTFDPVTKQTSDLQTNTLLEETADLQRVKDRHKTIMRNKYESLFEGIKLQENQNLLNKIYTQLYIIEGEREGVNEEHEVLHMEKKPRTQHSQDTQIYCNDIFKPLEEPGYKTAKRRRKDKIKSVLTKGIAGIGKTVSVQKFVLDWAEGTANQDVDFMFVLTFRELNLIQDDQYSLHKLLLDFHPELQDLDSKIYDECKVVFIFDGLDESRITLMFEDIEKVCDVTQTSSVPVLISNLIKGDLLPSAHIWITSRPAAANQIPSEYINRLTEIQGFNDPQKEEYFRKRISDEDQASRIISHIRRARSLHIMCHIPVFCWISSTVLQKILTQDHTAEIPQTLTEMYIHFLLIQINMKNEKYDENDPEELLQSNREVIVKLSELAFIQLMKGNVMFYEEDLRDCGIDITDASVYSGICTEIFKEESVIHQRKIYCFIHLSFQEFLAAFFVFCVHTKNVKQNYKGSWWSTTKNSLFHLLKSQVDTSLQGNGHLDLFLRFLLGISLDSNQRLLQNLLTHTENSRWAIKNTIGYIKDQIKSDYSEFDRSANRLKKNQHDFSDSNLSSKYQNPLLTDSCINLFEYQHDLLFDRLLNQYQLPLPTDRSINLFLCLLEMNDRTLYREIQEFVKSKKHSQNKLSPAHCSAIAYMLHEEVLDEFDLSKFNTSDEGRMILIAAVMNCRKALLVGCNLSDECYKSLASVLQSSNSLRDLDLSNNDLQDSRVKLISDGLNRSHCLNILRFVGCNLTDGCCEGLASVLQSSNSLRDLDLSYNNLQDSGVKLISDGLKSSHCQLNKLRLVGCNLTDGCCESLGSVLQSSHSLRDLDLSNNDLLDSGLKLICDGLKRSHCQLNILRLVSCNLTDGCCESLASVLQSSNSLRDLDLSNNDLLDSGLKLICEGLKSSHCQINILRLVGCNLTDGCCEGLASILQSPNSLRDLDLSNNDLLDLGVKLISNGLKSSHCQLNILRLVGCNLTDGCCESLASVLQSSNSLRDLDLSNNDLLDSGVMLISDGLKSSHCQLNILRLSGCMVTDEGCHYLASALSSNPSHLRELDLNYNHPGPSGVQMLTDKLNDPNSTLNKLNVDHGGKFRIIKGQQKYVCDLTLDSNTVNNHLILSEENRRVTHVWEDQAYPDNEERFDHYPQVLCKESLTGRCYWEVKFTENVDISVSYKGIKRKGMGKEYWFGYNEKSWKLHCANNTFAASHNNIISVISAVSPDSNTVGVYLDWSAGVLSFYSISDTHKLTHLHTYRTTFTEPLYAGFGVYSLNLLSLCPTD
ncbi:NACHT, LRR and PYD domains-containing protein 3-like isoform X9 [Misgurnus anguillicaudatus]|uniref:NACHT, LRR and PYD domains-containing protein 3-like isoform X9 n=1 Tax=Misgurnus anguillicaudatus TaxID=75329 RepID=UPI003CCFB2AE